MLEGQRIKLANIRQYTDGEPFVKYNIYGISYLLQNDYGALNDCTLVSITTIIKFLLPQEDIKNIYNNVEKIANQYGYKGWSGTPSLLIGLIYNKVLKYYKIDKKAITHCFKNIGFDYEDIKKSIDKNMPILLNLWKDGRNFYKNHTVVITGYYYTPNKKMLIVADNWYNTYSFIDYNLLNSICTIQILEK